METYRPEWWDFKTPDYSRIFQQRLDRLHRIRKDPSCLPGLKTYYKLNPAQFMMDWGITYDPRHVEIGLPAAMPFILFDKQIDFVNFIVEGCWKQREDGIIDKSRDVGASWLVVGLACTLCLHYSDMSIGMGSRKEEYVDDKSDPKALLYKARQFMRFLPVEFRGGWTEKDAPFMACRIPETNSVITGEAGDGIGRGARTGIYFVDESAHLLRPELVDASLSATTNCRVDLSSVKGMANPFAQKVHGGKIKHFRFHWRDDPRKDDAWYEKQKNKLSAAVLAQEIDIDYSASVEGVVIPSAWVQSAINAHVKLGITPTGAYRAALDVADEGVDINAAAGRHGVLLNRLQGWSGKGSDIYGTVSRMMGLCDAWGYKAFDYDADGLGVGVRGDARVLNEKRAVKINALPWRGSWEVRDPTRRDYDDRANEDTFANRKAQEWWALRRRFQLTHRWVTEGVKCDPDEIISIDGELPELSKLTVELSQPTYSDNGAGKKLIDKKPDGTASPNYADAVMICFAKGTGGGLNINRNALK